MHLLVIVVAAVSCQASVIPYHARPLFPYPYPPIHIPATTTTEANDVPIETVEFDCVGKFGDFELGCKNEYVSCVGVTAYLRHCPEASLRYSKEHQKCLEPNYVAVCGGTDEYTTQKPDDNVTPDPNLPHAPRVSCSGLPDGPLENAPGAKCQPFVLSCTGRPFAEVQYCAPGTFYDKPRKQCDFAICVPECGGDPDNCVFETSTGGGLPTTPATVDFDCNGKAPGYYVKQRCSEAYYHCNSAGGASAFYCPPGEFYNPSDNSCGATCRQGQPTTTPAPPQPHPHHHYGYHPYHPHPHYYTHPTTSTSSTTTSTTTTTPMQDMTTTTYYYHHPHPYPHHPYPSYPSQH